ncbi:MAG: metalloregulator ArsR/SmtB family transcription factor [Anaerolineales bacterium]|nr:metalloregulator ArsR/SmtB family transcription factor [Anaerolineales bacterium]
MAKVLREEINQLPAHICSGLAAPVRIFILYSLAEKPCHVNELAARTSLPQPTISRHLKTLRERSLVTSQRNGQYVYYQLADKRVIEALELLRAVMADSLKERAQIEVAHTH